MRTFSRFIPLVLLFSMLSCAEKTDNKLATLKLCDKEDLISVPTLYSSADIIPLFEKENHVLGSIGKVRELKGMYVVLDSDGKQLASFDYSGNSKDILMRVGRAYDEYLYIEDFDVSSTCVYMLCNPSKLFILDSKLKINKIVDLDRDLLVNKIYIHNNIIYLYSGNTRTLYYMNEKHEAHTVINETPLPVYPRNGFDVMFACKDHLLYISQGGDTIYDIKDSTATPFVAIDYPDKEKVINRYSQNRLLDLDEKFKYAAVTIHSIVDYNDYFLMTYTYSIAYRGCLIDKGDKSLIKDGYWSTNAPFPRSQSQEDVLSWQYVSVDEFPIDSNLISYRIYPPINPTEGNMAIFRYK